MTAVADSASGFASIAPAGSRLSAFARRLASKFRRRVSFRERRRPQHPVVCDRRDRIAVRLPDRRPDLTMGLTDRTAMQAVPGEMLEASGTISILRDRDRLGRARRLAASRSIRRNR